MTSAFFLLIRAVIVIDNPVYDFRFFSQQQENNFLQNNNNNRRR